MASFQDIVSYFRSCYQTDFKAIRIMNFFGKNVEHPLILKSAELLKGKLLQYPVDSQWGASMTRALALHSQEKTLCCCSFFLSGKMNVIGKPQKVFAPLYIHPVELVYEDDVYFLELDSENGVINPVFVEYIRSLPKDQDVSYDDLETNLPNGFIKFDEIFKIEQILQQFIPDLDVSQLNNYFDLSKVADLKKTYRQHSHNNSFSLIPGVGIGLVKKQTGSRGVLNELEKIETQNDVSAPLNEIFGKPGKSKIKTQNKSIITPVTLSKPQENIIQTYADHPLSLVVGPPGTGKSFTIAALVTDLISNGKTILIASKNDQAGKVISNKIEKDFGLKGVVIKTSTRSYRTQLQKRLNNIMYGMEVQRVDEEDLNFLSLGIQELLDEVEKLELEIEAREKEDLKWGLFYYKYSNSAFQYLKKFYVNNRVYNSMPIWKLMNQLQKPYKQLQTKSKAFVKKQFAHYLYEVLRNQRADMQNLLYGLQEETGNTTLAYFNKVNFDAILHALPAWIVNANDIHRVLPLKKEMFDVVVIDEATQCDMASSIPLLYRAKNAVIVGDPKQLRHLSFLSRKAQFNLVQKHNVEKVSSNKLDYRKNSLLDIVSASISNQDQVHFLDEHFRSKPDIIGFSNREFYDSKLKVMTALPTNIEQAHVHLHQCLGIRDSKGFNEAEAIKIVKDVKAILEKESTLPRNLSKSIGILSPFRSQVTYLKKIARQNLDSKLFTKHQILIGTPYQFQGEERDLMFLSFVVNEQTHPSTFLYLNRPDVFNVSITRAKNEQHVYVSTYANKLNPKHLFTQFIDFVDHGKANRIKGTEHLNLELDHFMEDVIKVLKRWKITKIYRAYPIAGMDVDLVVVHDKKTYCIDLIGYPGAYVDKFPMDRWRIMERIGLETFTLSYASWHIDRDYCRHHLKKFIFDNR